MSFIDEFESKVLDMIKSSVHLDQTFNARYIRKKMNIPSKDRSKVIFIALILRKFANKGILKQEKSNFRLIK